MIRRFGNTLHKLQDCRNAISEGPPDSTKSSFEERLARWELLRLCAEIAENYRDEMESAKPKE